MGLLLHSTGRTRGAGAVVGPDPEFAVVLLNDEAHFWAYVIRLLRDVFGIASEDGFDLVGWIPPVRPGDPVCRPVGGVRPPAVAGPQHGPGRDHPGLGRPAAGFKAFLTAP